MSLGHGASIVRNGLVLHLDAANKKSYPGAGTVWNDLSGNGNNGTLVNGVGYSSNNSGILSFDGTNDYVDVPLSESQLNFSSGFTWSTFVYVNDIVNNPYTGFMSTYVGTPSGTASALKVQNASFEFRSYGLNLIIISGNILPLQTWVMLTAVWNSIGSYQMYENDKLVRSGSAPTSYSPSTGNSLRIGGGAYSMGAAANLKGSLSVSQIFNRALSAVEIQQNFNALRGRYGI